MFAPHRIASSLSTLFHPVLRALRMATQPSSREFINGEVAVWYDLVHALCMLDEACLQRFEDPKSFIVRKIRHYKELSLSQHEYLVAEVHPRNSSPVYVKLERLIVPAESDNTKSTSSPSPTTRPSFSSSFASAASASSSNSMRSSAKPLANDQVSILPRGWPTATTRSFVPQVKHAAKRKEYTLLRRWRRKKNRRMIIIEEADFSNVTLYDLLILSRVMHDHSPVYELLRRQCYWFSNLLLRVLMVYDPDSLQISFDAEVERETLEVEALTYLPRLQGTWHRVPIHEFTKRGQEELTDLFFTKRQNFGDEINTTAKLRREAAEAQAMVQFEAGLRAKAMKQADDAMKQADDAMKQADDAMKQADDAVQRANEQTKRAEEAEEEIRVLKAMLAAQRIAA